MPLKLLVTCIMSEEEKSYLISKEELLSGMIGPLTDQSETSSENEKQGCARSLRYMELADAQKWEELRSDTENELSNVSDDLVARVWWLFSQMKLKHVPLSILSGSIDEVTERVIEDTGVDVELRSRAAKLLELAGEQLAEEKQYELSAHFLKRAEKVLPSAVGKTDVVLEKEKAELKSLPAYTLSDDEKEKIRHPNPSRPSKEKSESTWKARSLLIYLVIFLLVGGYLFFGKNRLGAGISSLLFEPSEKLVLSLKRSLSTRKLVLPPLERADGTALDALKYEMDNIFKVGEQTEEAATPEVVDPSAVQEKQELKLSSSSNSEEQPVRKEALDLSGPSEPSDFPKEVSDSQGTEEVMVEESSPLVVRKDFAREFPGRTRNQAGANSEFPRRFEVIAKSEVRASPSYHAAVLKELQIDDRVEVIREELPWAVVRSRRGNIGYVLSQDLTPVED